MCVWIFGPRTGWLLSYTMIAMLRSTEEQANWAAGLTRQMPSRIYCSTLPETNMAPEKWMLGIRSFPFGKPYFHGLCLFQGGYLYDVMWLLAQRGYIDLLCNCKVLHLHIPTQVFSIIANEFKRINPLTLHLTFSCLRSAQVLACSHTKSGKWK